VSVVANTCDRPARTWPIRAAVLLVAPGLAAGWMLTHQELLAEGVRLLGGSERDWLAVALLATGARWPAGGLNLQGAVRQRLPVGRLLPAGAAFAYLVRRDVL